MFVTTAPSGDQPAIDHPGRWVGGALGAAASAMVALAGAVVGDRTALDADFVAIVGITGMPVGFVLGRAALPWARATKLPGALGVGTLLAFVAPPLGALGFVVLGALTSNSGELSGCVVSPYMALIALPLVAAYAYLALVVTIPAGLLWALLAWSVPESILIRARMPQPVAALGVRHVVAVLAVGLVVVGAVQIATRSACAAW